MEIEYLSESNAAEWEAFAATSSSAWFRHTLAWQKYSACCRFDSNTRNFSFMVKQNGRIQAIVPLLAEYSYPEMTFDCFAMYGDYTPLPAFADDDEVRKSSVVEAIRSEVAAIAAREGIRYGKFIVDPLISLPYFRDFSWFNMLEEGASVSFGTTNVVDLTAPEDEILRRMRKGHKAAIKQVIRDGGYRVDVFDASNITMDKMLRFKEIHRIDAGRQTRTDASWECMYEWVASGCGCLVMLWLESLGDYGAAALIMHYKKAAYYASYGILDSGFLNGHAGDIIQWEAIRHLKAAGIEIYEMGDNYFGLVPAVSAGVGAGSGSAVGAGACSGSGVCAGVPETADAYASAKPSAASPQSPTVSVPTISDNDRKLLEIAKYKRGFRSAEIPKIKFRKTY